MDATVAGVVSGAEAAIRALNEGVRPALAPLARLLLRTESIASSKIEGMQTGVTATGVQAAALISRRAETA